MSVVIEGFKMPHDCMKCPLRTTFSCHCFDNTNGFMDVSRYTSKRHPKCPLKKVSDKKK